MGKSSFIMSIDITYLKETYCILLHSPWLYLLFPLIKSFILFFKIIIPRVTIPDKYIPMYKLINILYKNTAFNRYDIHTNINATLSVIIIIYISQYTFLFLDHKKNNIFVYLLSFIFSYIFLYQFYLFPNRHHKVVYILKKSPLL